MPEWARTQHAATVYAHRRPHPSVVIAQAVNVHLDVQFVQLPLQSTPAKLKVAEVEYIVSTVHMHIRGWLLWDDTVDACRARRYKWALPTACSLTLAASNEQARVRQGPDR